MTVRSYFITGTGTDVGKTLVSAGIVCRALESGIPAVVVKPVQTGTDDYPADIDTISSLVPGLTALPRELSMPFEFKFAASPHLAAAMEGKCLKLKDIVAVCRRAEKAVTEGMLLFEGAGGVMVPLNDRDFMLDLARELGHPVIVVSDARLGTINHTLLTVAALRHAGVTIAGVVVNNMPGDDDPVAADNIKIIRERGDVRILAVIRRISGNPDLHKLSAAFSSFDPHSL